jgi:hypothetical protein
MEELRDLQRSLRTIDKHMSSRAYINSSSKALWIDARVTTLAAIAALTDTDATYSGANITIEFPDNTDVQSFDHVDSEASLERFTDILHGMAVSYFGSDAHISVFVSSKYRVCVNDSYNVVKLADMVRDWCQSVNDSGNWIVNKATNNV